MIQLELDYPSEGMSVKTLQKVITRGEKWVPLWFDHVIVAGETWVKDHPQVQWRKATNKELTKCRTCSC